MRKYLGMSKKAKRIIAAIFLIPLICVVAIQPSNAEEKALLDKKAVQAAYLEKLAEGNVFHAPRDTSGVIWNFIYNRKDMIHKVSLDYTTLPKPKTEAEFKEMSEFAKNYIGIKYTPAGKSPATGFDCSGFVLYVFKHMGSNMTAGGSVEQLNCSVRLPEGYEKPGDLVFFKGTGVDQNAEASHVGIYLGDRQMIHAGNGGIAIVSLDNEYWPQHFMCFARPIEW